MGTALKFVKVKDILQIPRYLFEQVKPQEYNIDKLYEWGPVILKNPVNLVGAFIDKEEIVKGVMWSSFDPISNKILVHLLSVDKVYFKRGILQEAEGILNKFKKKLGANKISFMTSRPKAFEKIIGARKVKVIMEK
jgi:hypothetical protein